MVGIHLFAFYYSDARFLIKMEPFWALFQRYERTNERTDGGQAGPGRPALAQVDSQPVDGRAAPPHSNLTGNEDICERCLELTYCYGSQGFYGIL